MNDEVKPVPTVTFRGKEYTIELAKYQVNGNTVINLVDSFGNRQLTATSNFEPLPPHLVYIKDWSENKGVEAALRRLIHPTGEYRKAGFARAYQFELGEALCGLLGIPAAGSEDNGNDPHDFGPTFTEVRTPTPDLPDESPDAEEPDDPKPAA